MNRTKGLLFLGALPALLLATGFCLAAPAEIAAGLRRIALSPSLLLTDYLAVGGPAAAYVNAGLCGLVAVALVALCRVEVNGPFIAAVYTVVGFAFFGKNIYNIWPILIGVYLHTLCQGVPYRNSLLVALFGTTLAPLVSYFSFAAGLPAGAGALLGVLLGLAAGFILPPLASHMLRFHEGYNIYNVGFTGGIIGSFVIANARGLGFETPVVTVLSWEPDHFHRIFFAGVSLALAAYGLLLARADKAALGRSLVRILHSSGRLVSDFTQIGGYPASFVNMGVMGLVSLLFVAAVGGRCNGPVIGGLLTVVGFAAFGKHPRNCLPVLAGVALASFFKIWETSAPIVALAGLFGTTLAPIAGHYGPFAGLAAGFFHLSVVANVGVLHGGVNLYNNGFAGGFVAAFLVPVLNFLKRNERNGRSGQ